MIKICGVHFHQLLVILLFFLIWFTKCFLGNFLIRNFEIHSVNFLCSDFLTSAFYFVGFLQFISQFAFPVLNLEKDVNLLYKK